MEKILQKLMGLTLQFNPNKREGTRRPRRVALSTQMGRVEQLEVQSAKVENYNVLINSRKRARTIRSGGCTRKATQRMPRNGTTLVQD